MGGPSTGSPSPFSPLDPAERLPREEVLDRGRGGLQLQRKPEGWRKLTRAKLAAVLATPSLILLGLVLAQSGASLLLAVVSVAFLILALVGFAFLGRRTQRIS